MSRKAGGSGAPWVATATSLRSLLPVRVGESREAGQTLPEMPTRQIWYCTPPGPTVWGTQSTSLGTEESAMRRTLLSALVGLVIARVGFCQQPVSPGVGAAPTLGALPAQLPAPNAQADEIQALKASMLQLQQRLDRLAPPPEGNAVGLPPAVPPPPPPWELPSPQVTFAGPVCPCPPGTVPAKVESSPAWP